MKTTLPSCSTLLIFFVLCLQLSSCNDTSIAMQQNKTIEVVDSSNTLSIESNDSSTYNSWIVDADTMDVATLTPLWGYRFIITGDFDGNGIKDTLRERHVEEATGEETNKFFEEIGFEGDYQTLERPAIHAFLQANSSSDISNFESMGTLGLHWLENIGNINTEKGDEIGVLAYNMDYSNCNTYRIYTYKNNRWEVFYAVEVLELDFPDLPCFHLEDGYSDQHESISATKQADNKILQTIIDTFQFARRVAKNTIALHQAFPTNCEHQYKINKSLSKKSKYVWVTNIGKQDEENVKSTHIQTYSSSVVEAQQDIDKGWNYCEGAPGFYPVHVVFK